jgi:hypothetical protein
VAGWKPRFPATKIRRFNSVFSEPKHGFVYNNDRRPLMVQMMTLPSAVYEKLARISSDD